MGMIKNKKKDSYHAVILLDIHIIRLQRLIHQAR